MAGCSSFSASAACLSRCVAVRQHDRPPRRRQRFQRPPRGPLTIPPHPDFTLVPVVASSPPALAAEQQAILLRRGCAIAAIDGGFFAPLHGQTTSAVIRDRALLADPRQNQRRVAHPDLAPYLPQSLDGSEGRQYRCPEGNRPAIARRYNRQRALGAGPHLLAELAAPAEGFVATVNGQVVRAALGRDRRHTRSALCLAADGTLILAMARQTPEGVARPELALFLEARGAIAALNLDGSSSASLDYRSNTSSNRPTVQTVCNPLSVRLSAF